MVDVVTSIATMAGVLTSHRAGWPNDVIRRRWVGALTQHGDGREPPGDGGAGF